MRFIPILLVTFILTGCETIDSWTAPSKIEPVNVATLPPLSGREQALIIGADGAFQQGNYPAAERDYLAAAEASTGHVEAHLALARLYEKQKAPEKEQAILLRALLFQPNQPLANYRLGKLYLDANKYDPALKAFKRGRISMPDDMDLAMGEAVAQDMLGSHAEAQMNYLRIIANHPKANLTPVRTNLGMSYLLSNDPKKTVELLKKEVKKPEATEVTRHNLALAYGMLGRNADARNVLKGDIDEDTRLLAVARLKEYVEDRAKNSGPPPVAPMVKTPSTVDPVGNPALVQKGSSVSAIPAAAAPAVPVTIKPADKPKVEDTPAPTKPTVPAKL